MTERRTVNDLVKEVMDGFANLKLTPLKGELQSKIDPLEPTSGIKDW